MASIQILGTTIPIEFKIGQDAKRPLNEAQLLTGAQQMAALINSRIWTDAQKNAFTGIKKIVFFEGKVMVDGHLMDRPCCDQDDAIFYWEAEEFERNTDADVRANTFFHDCWHVVQFKRDGAARADDVADQVAREVDAINEQLKVCEILGNSQQEMQHLIAFRDDQQRIRERLKEGVGTQVAPHKTGAIRK